MKARVTSGGTSFSRGYQVVEYPHIRRAHIYRDAEVVLKVIDVKIAPNLKIADQLLGDLTPSNRGGLINSELYKCG